MYYHVSLLSLSLTLFPTKYVYFARFLKDIMLKSNKKKQYKTVNKKLVCFKRFLQKYPKSFF